MTRLNVGLISLGRLGRVYARDLAGRIPETRLVAVADPVASLAQEVAAECDVPTHYTDPTALIVSHRPSHVSRPRFVFIDVLLQLANLISFSEGVRRDSNARSHNSTERTTVRSAATF